MQSHDAEYRESGEGWARTPKPPAMTVPLSDARLAAYRARYTHPHGPVAIANGHVDAAVLLAEVERLRALLAAEPAQPSPEHQAIYLDDFDQVWCDYPTVPAGDDVLPLVWASERAQSRSELADGGNRLRVIGWCR